MTIKVSSLDKHRTLIGGFSSALKDSDAYYFFINLFNEMDTFAAATVGKRSSPGLYLKERYGDDALADIFTKISALYREGLAPLAVGAENTFLSSVQSVFGESGCSENIKSFAQLMTLFTERDRDFERAKEMLRVDCLDVIFTYTPPEEAIKKTDPRAAMASRDQRYSKISSLFDSSGISLVSSESDEMTAFIDKSYKVGRIKTHSGVDINSFDAKTGGVPGSGLTEFLAGTSDGKTALMAALCANIIVNYYDALMAEKAAFAPKIWGYIGEDSIDTYIKRILVNFINQRWEDIGLSQITMREFLSEFNTNESFRATIKEFRSELMSGLKWVKPPTSSSSIFDFSLNKLLKSFENWFLTEGKPDFIILDYIQLLRLDKSVGLSGKRTEELNTIAEVLNTWAASHDIAIITGVQATADGMRKSRDLGFHEIEDIAEAKGMSRPAHMILSLIRIPELSDTGEYLGQKQAIKVLKNRDGEKEQIFIGDLDFARCISFSNLKLVEPKVYIEMVNRIRNIRSADQIDDKKKTQRSSFGGGQRPFSQKPNEQKPNTGQKSEYKPITPPDTGDDGAM